MDVPAGLTARVRAQYEAFPYPAYGLFLPLRSQEAYASNSLFAARLLEQRGRMPALRGARSPGVLLAGCGDVFPYIATFWEPRRHALTAADLSARSLRRARLRCLPRMRAIEWRRGDLGDAGFALPVDLAHIDCYGVLHHLARPAPALARLGRLLAPGGTARIMVYNSAARGWIRHVQRAFAALGLSAHVAEDRERGLALLKAAAGVSPALRDRLAAGDALDQPARFVDTFFHAREARVAWNDWLQAAAAAGLEPIGLYDRYGELDDLANPLLEFPAAEALRERISDRRFENNLELWLAKPGAARRAVREPIRLPSAQALKTPPKSWWGYRETSTLPWDLRLKAWRHFLANLTGRHASADAWAARVPPRAFQRLGRLGAIFPDECASDELKALLRKPLEDAMEPPEWAAATDLRKGLRARIEAIGRDKGLRAKALELALARLDAAQRP